MNWGHLLFGVSGRINRAKWWLTVLILVIFSVVVGIVQQFATGIAATVVVLLFYIVYFWISVAAGAKRLHDLDRAAAWLVIFYGAPLLLIVGSFAYAVMSLGLDALTNPNMIDNIGGPDISLGGFYFFAVVILAIGLWALIWLGCLRGTVGPNRYGTDPLPSGA